MISRHKILILEELRPLESMGFRLVSGGAISTEDRLTFENSFIRIDINYDVFVNTSSFLVFISRVNGNAGYLWESYLDYIRVPHTKMHHGESDEDYIRRFLGRFLDHLQSDFKPVVSGERWLDIHTDYRQV
jgi:hypothetical protein